MVTGSRSSEQTAFVPNPEFSMHSFDCHFVEVTWQPEIARLRVGRVVTAMDAGRILNPPDRLWTNASPCLRSRNEFNQLFTPT